MRRDVNKAHLGAIHLFKNAVRFLQLQSALLQILGHFVEGIGQHSDLILAHDLGPFGQVAARNGV